MIQINKNLLSEELSPYLKQHKDNPVNWQIWSEETLEFAIDNYKQHFDIGALDMFPRKYDELIKNFNYFRGFEVEGDGSVDPNNLNFN